MVIVSSSLLIKKKKKVSKSIGKQTTVETL